MIEAVQFEVVYFVKQEPYEDIAVTAALRGLSRSAATRGPLRSISMRRISAS
jgi:hypothetical protein